MIWTPARGRSRETERKIMKRIAVLALAAVVLFGFNACIFSPEKTIPPVVPPAKFLPLDKRDNVLKNLQTAYNARNIGEYDKLLDADFIFYFSYADVSSSEWTAGDYWDRAHELQANRNLFDPAYSTPTREPASSIVLSLTYVEGEENWTQITPDPVKYPGEIWYEKIVKYDINVKSGAMTFIGNQKNASFVVRLAHVEGQGDFWRIVTWRDDTGT
jgi:hypothetical protein